MQYKISPFIPRLSALYLLMGHFIRIKKKKKIFLGIDSVFSAQRKILLQLGATSM